MIAYLDCATGVSGDKFLGTLVDAGFDIATLRDMLSSCGLTDITIDVSPRASHGISGIGLSVSEPDAPRRTWRDLAGIVEGASLPQPVRERTLTVLRTLADAEARVHGGRAEDVHFHEIGAADTLVDVLGVVLGLSELGIDELVVSRVAVGSGPIDIEHGRFSAPAPATSLLLEGVPVEAGDASGELTTPTGAALVATLATRFGGVPGMVLRRTGVGCGTRDLGVPNVCRLLLGEPEAVAEGAEDVVVLETNIDHLTPEELASAAGRILEQGARDVWQVPILMKKGRSATQLSVLAVEADAARLADVVIGETGTLGVRILPAWRRLVQRDIAEIATSLGSARFKVARLADGRRALRVEQDDAVAVARELGIPVDEAVARLEADAARLTGVQPMRQRPSS